MKGFFIKENIRTYKHTKEYHQSKSKNLSKLALLNKSKNKSKIEPYVKAYQDQRHQSSSNYELEC